MAMNIGGGRDDEPMPRRAQGAAGKEPSSAGFKAGRQMSWR